MAHFDLDGFIAECHAALNEDNTLSAALDVVARAVSDPAALIQTLGTPQRAGIETLYHDDELTILNLCWGPGMELKAHNHQMWAAIGIYGGREQNTFYRRGDEGLIRHGTKELHAKDAVPLGDTIIHSVRNPLDKLTGAIHVYGGDFFTTPRSEWDPDTLQERPYSVEDTRRVFDESNRRLDAGPGAAS